MGEDSIDVGDENVDMEDSNIDVGYVVSLFESKS
jgi:hypothetical protein